MANAKQLPFLIRLLDDDSRVVQDKVKQELQELGGDLIALCTEQGIELSAKQRRSLRAVMCLENRMDFQASWLEWLEDWNSSNTLHNGMELIANYLDVHEQSQNLDVAIAGLAQSFQEQYPGHKSPLVLARFLFSEKGFKGNKADYYSPSNSSLLYVLESKHGIPLSLCCLYILVGKHLDMNIQGCNFPGHFLARVTYKNQSFLVDAFEGGRSFPDEIFFNPKGSQFRAVVSGEQLVPSARLIGLRTLNNLSHAFRKLEQTEDAEFFESLSRTTQSYIETHEL